MRNKMFADLIEKKRTMKRWLFLPLSLLVHAVVIVSVIVVPLMSDSDNLPEVNVIGVRMVATPPPPPAAPARRKRGKINKKKKDKPIAKPITTGRLIQPVTIPEDIPEPEIEDIGFGEGIEGGVIGGVEGGVQGGVLGSALLGEGNNGMQQQIRVSQIKVPKLLKKVSPNYPTAAIKAHVNGMVLLEAVTDVFGRVAKVRIINGHPLLQGAAVYAVKQWIYEPYIINGIAKPVVFTVTVTFSLQR